MGPDGMLECKKGLDLHYYCSSDCLQWDMEGGECHKNVVLNVTRVENEKHETKVESSDEASMEAFIGIDINKARVDEEGGENEVTHRYQRASGESSICKSCGIDSEFNPDGMIKCEQCRKVTYCSIDCLQWDWENGGHKNACEGFDSNESLLPQPLDSTDDDSIDAFNDGPDYLRDEGKLDRLEAVGNSVSAEGSISPVHHNNIIDNISPSFVSNDDILNVSDKSMNVEYTHLGDSDDVSPRDITGSI